MKPSDFIKKGWCQKVSARNSQGLPCNPTDIDATEWCLVGAVFAAFPTDMHKRIEVWEQLRATLEAQGAAPVFCSNWNDVEERKQEEVVSLLESIGY